MAKFSIVIPCYNSFNKMEKCLKNLENQTFRNFEVVIIDDCSTDLSFKDLNEYKKNSKLNINLIKNENNLGAGESRNIGINNSKGEYITFVDSDDYIEENTLEIFSKIINEKKVDCIIYDYYYQTNKGKNRKKSFLKGDSGIINKSDAIVYSTASTWGKVYLLNNIRNNQIKFPNFKRNEDMPFNKLAISVSNKIYYCDENLYNYVDNKDSLMYNKKLDDENNAINAFNLLYENMNLKFPKEIEAIFLKQYLYPITLGLIKKKSKKEEILKHIENCEKKYPNIYQNESKKYMSKSQKICIFAIKHRMIFLLRLIVKLKEIAKKII